MTDSDNAPRSLDYAEDQASRRKLILLCDRQTKVDDFLRFNDRAVLSGAGRVSRKDADRRAWEQHERFEERPRAEREAEGEMEAIKAREAAAKALPPRGKKKPGGAA